MIIQPGATSISITIQIVDDSGLAVTGLVAATFPTTYYQRAGESLPASITLADLAAQNSAYSSGGVKELTGGYYRLDVPDAAFTTASRVNIIGEATGKHILFPPITCAYIQSDLRTWLGTAPLALSSQQVQAVVPASTVVASVTGAVGSVTAGVTVTTNNDKTGYSLTQSFPANFASLAITAAGGVTLADGAHGGTSAVLTLDHMIVQPAAGNTSAVSLTGSGLGAGLAVEGGTTGLNGAPGLAITGGSGSSTGGVGLRVVAGTPNSSAASFTGQGSEDGLSVTAGATGHAIHLTGGNTSGSALFLSTTNGAGLDENGTDYKAAIWAYATRTITGGTITTYTGNTPQTGDAFARLGAPAGASVSADLAAVQADLPQRITKNTALAGFSFPMVLASDHVTGATGKTVTATRSIDGAAFAACTNAVTEISNGFYTIDLAAADLNGNVITFLFTATACDPTRITVVTEPT